MSRNFYENSLGEIAYYHKLGQPLIVFLEGFGDFDTLQNFSKIIKELSPQLGILAIDYLNSGFSSRSFKSYTLSEEANEIATLINSFKAKNVILVSHSLGGVYAFQMQQKVKHLTAFIGIEPTTREIILNTPQTEAYRNRPRNTNEFLAEKIQNLFSTKEANEFLKTTNKLDKRFSEKDNQNAFEAIKNDSFWLNKDVLQDDIVSIIFTEAYRKAEYQRSEYFNHNPRTKIITLGTFHYLQWECPQQINQIILQLTKSLYKK